jgi:hypothetical protein
LVDDKNIRIKHSISMNPPKKYGQQNTKSKVSGYLLRSGSHQSRFIENDEATGQVAVCCDLIGKVMFADLEIYDVYEKLWQLRANRKQDNADTLGPARSIR